MEAEETSAHEDILAPLRDKYGDIAVWNVPGYGLVVAAVPQNDKEYHRLVNALKNEKQDTAIALEQFALACVVHPDRETTKRIFKAKRAFALKVAKRGQELCGADIEELGKD